LNRIADGLSPVGVAPALMARAPSRGNALPAYQKQ
jgi:hypothetical protein